MSRLHGNRPGDGPAPVVDSGKSMELPRPRLAFLWILAVLVASLAPIAKSIVARLAR